jgi:hypothetical protein
MNDRQDAKLNMYQKVLDVCSENEQKYANIPAFASAVNELKQRVTDIKSTTQQQTVTNPKGTTKEKSSTVDSLVELSLKVAGALYVYAFNSADKRLLEKVNVNKSVFYHTHNQTTLTLTKIIAAEAGTYSEVLNNYGITAADLADLNTAIVQFEKLINAPAGVVVERKLYTDNLRELFVAADSIVYDKLDKLIRLFKVSSPEFFGLYSNARNVINTAARKRKDNSPKQEKSEP